VSRVRAAAGARVVRVSCSCIVSCTVYGNGPDRTTVHRADSPLYTLAEERSPEIACRAMSPAEPR